MFDEILGKEFKYHPSFSKMRVTDRPNDLLFSIYFLWMNDFITEREKNIIKKRFYKKYKYEPKASKIM